MSAKAPALRTLETSGLSGWDGAQVLFFSLNLAIVPVGTAQPIYGSGGMVSFTYTCTGLPASRVTMHTRQPCSPRWPRDTDYLLGERPVAYKEMHSWNP